jgi:hypothetical protein
MTNPRGGFSMNQRSYIPYAPLQCLKPFADEVWIVDGPEIGMGYFGLTLPFPTRMAVVRLVDRKLWVHSPIAWNDDLAAEIDQLGTVEYLVAPNTLHYSYLETWRSRYPQARSYGPPGLDGRADTPAIDEVLGETPPEAWDDAFAQCLVPGALLTEVDFFHRASRTLIITDLIENFEPRRVRNRFLRWIMQASGATDPDGKAPIDMQLSFIRHRRAVRSAALQMIAWAPQKIILAHGRCYDKNAVAELRRAFRWVL